MILLIYSIRMKALLLVLFAASLAWLAAVYSLMLPHYKTIRRKIPARSLVTVLFATLATIIAISQSEMWLSRIFLALWSVVLTLVAVIDIETHLVPNVLIWPATGGALIASLVDPRLSFISSLLGMLMGFLIFYMLYYLGRLRYKNGLGLGDVNLSTFIGAITGVEFILDSLLIGIMTSGLVILFLLALKRVTLTSHIPYAPYLCFGGWLGMQSIGLGWLGM